LKIKLEFRTDSLDIENSFQYGTGCRFYSFTVIMKLLRLTKGAVISATSLFLLAGGAAYPVVCGTGSCCCMPEVTDDLALHQGHCDCGCGQFEQSQVPDQSAVTVAVLDTKPIETKFDYTVEIDNDILEKINFQISIQEKTSHSPPLIPDNRYTPLLC